MAKRAVTDAEILAQMPAARRRARRMHPVATEVRYDRAHRRLCLTLTNGTSLIVPIDLISSLGKASERELVHVAVGAAGISLRWADLDQDLSLAGLAHLALGRQVLMRASGSAGGAARSPAKARAARANGKKRGRPKSSRL